MSELNIDDYEFQVGENVSVDIDIFAVNRALKKANLEYEEAEVNKCMGAYCVVKEINKELLLVEFKNGKKYWFPAEILLADEEDSSFDSGLLDDQSFNERPGGDDLILVNVKVDDVARGSVRTSVALLNNSSSGFLPLTDKPKKKANCSLLALPEEEELKLQKGHIVWKKIDSHWVESVVREVKNDSTGNGLLLKLGGDWVPESEVSITQPTAYDIGYITSAPLVYRTMSKIHPLEELDLAKDENLLKKCLQESEKNFKVVKCSASILNLFSICNKGCTVLHYSGHGVRGSLAFESNKEIGTTQFITNEYLQEVLTTKAGHTGVKLAVVSACHSEKAGEAFVEAGVSHVVAIKHDNALHDDAAQNFTVQFYKWLFSGNSVSSSFKAAKMLIISAEDASRHDSKLFLLLPENKSHQEVLFQNQREGKFEFNQLQQIAPTNLPTKPELFIGRAIFQREVILSVLVDRCVLVYGPSGEGKCELVKMAARYIHDRNLDQFSGGVVWVDLKKQYLRQASSHGPGTVSRKTLFDSIWSTVEEIFSSRDIPELRQNLSWQTPAAPQRTESGRLVDKRRQVDKRRYFSQIAPKMLFVIRGLEYLPRTKGQIQETFDTITELLASPASPHLLLTHRQDLRGLNVKITRHHIPMLGPEDVGKIFCARAKGLIYNSELREPLAPPCRWQLRWKGDEGLYKTSYCKTHSEAKEEVEKLEKKRIQAKIHDLSPNGKDIKFPVIPELEGLTHGDDDDKKTPTVGERYVDFVGWLTSNPKRIIRVAKFAMLQNLNSPWDIISGFSHNERLESVRMVCELKLMQEGSLNDVHIKKLFDLDYLVNRNRRMKWNILKKLLSIRFGRTVSLTLKSGEKKFWTLSDFDWGCIEDKVLPNCTTAQDWSVSEEGFVFLMLWFIKNENTTKKTLNSLKAIHDKLPKDVMVLNEWMMFARKRAWNKPALNNWNREWNNSILCDATGRVPVKHVDQVLPICLWNLLPNSSRTLAKEEIDWISEHVIKEKFITRRELESVSWHGWRAFSKSVLWPWCSIISKELDMWNMGVLVGFCSRQRCVGWLSRQSQSAGTFIVRFSTSRFDGQSRYYAVAITYINNDGKNGIRHIVVDFDVDEKLWRVSGCSIKRFSLADVIEECKLTDGLNPYTGEKYSVKNLKKSDTSIYVNIKDQQDIWRKDAAAFYREGETHGQGERRVEEGRGGEGTVEQDGDIFSPGSPGSQN